MYNKDLDIFKAVAETGSFSKAAQKVFYYSYSSH